MHHKSNLFYFLLILSVIMSGCGPSAAPINTSTTTPSDTSTPGPKIQNIVDLVEQGIITFTITSGAINELGLEVQNITDQPLQIEIPVGTYFENLDPETQNMVILHQASTSIKPFGQAEILLDAACANLHLNEPTQEDTFTILRAPNSELLTEIVNKLVTAKVEYPVEQAAVWIVTDDATYDELGLLVEGSRFGSSIINENDALRAMMLVEDAGLDIRSYVIWQDRTQLVGMVNETDLSDWLDDQVATQVVMDSTATAQEATQIALASPTPIGEIISQYATAATASSQYSTRGNSAMQAVDSPDITTCGDIRTAWASKSATTQDWLLLTYERAVIPSRIVIFETYHPGAVSLVEVLDEEGNPTTVYEATPAIVTQCPNSLEIDVSDVNVPVRSIRVTIDQRNHNGWAEIDAVQLVGTFIPSIDTSFPFALTGEKYHETDAGIESACSLELGSTWKTADWNDISAYSQGGNSIQDLVSTLVLSANTPYLVTYNEEGWFSTQRHYIFELHDHTLPRGWLSHQEIDDHYVDLGSWYGLDAQILCHKE
jgi:hypothetical protein